MAAGASGSPPSRTRSAAAISASPPPDGVAPAASCSTQAPSSPAARSSRANSVSLAGRSSASHTFITFSMLCAASANRFRPTIRPLPLSVWKQRRSMVRLSTAPASARGNASVVCTNCSTSCASAMKISSSSASTAASLAGAGASATGSGGGTGGGICSSSTGIDSAAAILRNGTARKVPCSASKVKRSRAPAGFCASMSTKKPSAPTFCAMSSSAFGSSAGSPSPWASAAIAPCTWPAASIAWSWSRMASAPCSWCITPTSSCSDGRLDGST